MKSLAMVSYALLGYQNKEKVRAMGKDLIKQCPGREGFPSDNRCAQYKLASDDPERFIRRFENAKKWMQENHYSEKFVALNDRTDTEGLDPADYRKIKAQMDVTPVASGTASH